MTSIPAPPKSITGQKVYINKNEVEIKDKTFYECCREIMKPVLKFIFNQEKDIETMKEAKKRMTSIKFGAGIAGVINGFVHGWLNINPTEESIDYIQMWINSNIKIKKQMINGFYRICNEKAIIHAFYAATRGNDRLESCKLSRNYLISRFNKILIPHDIKQSMKHRQLFINYSKL